MASTLTTLPPELLLEIFAYLPFCSLIAIAFVNKRFNSLMPPEPYRYRQLSECQNNAIYRSLREPLLRKCGLRNCRKCRGDYNDNERYFRGRVPICFAHDGYLESPEIPRGMEVDIKWLLYAYARLRTSWIALERIFCSHRRELRSWKGLFGSCCRCEHCGHFEITCLVRTSMADDAPKAWERSPDGKFMIEYDRPARKFVRVLGTSRWTRLLMFID
jgi:hypothetical protein